MALDTGYFVAGEVRDEGIYTHMYIHLHLHVYIHMYARMYTFDVHIYTLTHTHSYS